jgi:hypothetical protein
MGKIDVTMLSTSFVLLICLSSAEEVHAGPPWPGPVAEFLGIRHSFEFLGIRHSFGNSVMWSFICNQQLESHAAFDCEKNLREEAALHVHLQTLLVRACSLGSRTVKTEGLEATIPSH